MPSEPASEQELQKHGACRGIDELPVCPHTTNTLYINDISTTFKMEQRRNKKRELHSLLLSKGL